ncbi:MAG: TlpA family protein disulfide reductase [Eubacterium sp.]|nr:TlpA family protein disulfide reductase [Eubacterium sp.]
MKRKLPVLLACSLAVLLAACSSSSSGKAEDAAAASDTTNVAASESVVEEDSAAETESAAEADSAAEPENAVGTGETAEAEDIAQENAAADSALSFETTDLEGNTVRSEDIFSENKITMVNIWGTFCGPCISEMPSLEELNGRLDEKDCGVIGIVCDVAGPEDTGQIETAKEIIGTTGVTYQNLLPWDGFDEALPAMFIPMTYFVNAEGQLTGEPSVGAKGADEYEALVDEILQKQ